MKLYIGVHHNPPNSVASTGIILGTQALFSNYVMGPKYPSTHAFVVVETEDQHWALDGKPPYSEWSPCFMENGRAQSYSTLWRRRRPGLQALWQIKEGVVSGVHAARNIDAEKYDWGEIAAAAGTAFSFVPGLQKLKMLGRVDLFHDAMICTHVAIRVMQGCGGPVAESVKNLPDLFPERLAQILQRAEGTWCERVGG